MKKGDHGFNDINERFVGNEQKLVFTIQKFTQTVGVRAKKKVVNVRERKVTLFVTIRVILGHKSYFFLLDPINTKSVEPKFHGYGASIQEAIKLQKVTFCAFRLHLIF